MSSTTLLLFISTGIIFGIIFFLFGYFTRYRIGEKKIRTAELKAQEIEVAAERAAEKRRQEMEKEADRYLLRLKNEFDEDLSRKKAELDSMDREVRDKERELDQYADMLERKEGELESRIKRFNEDYQSLKQDRKKLDQLLEEEREKLKSISGIGKDEAKRQLMKTLESDVRLEASRMIRHVEEEANQIAERKAKNILALAMQKCATHNSMETTVSVIALPSEEMKGRIIGKEGRNVRTFEQCSGVDVVIDDSPGTVVLSAFDPVRREIARIAMERLIEDGRIHPSTIEETIAQVKKDIDETIRTEGNNALLEIGAADMDPELTYRVGTLKFRSSYGQNGLDHSKEVAFILGTIASEMGIDPRVAKRAGLLHDIGKTVSHEVEGPHAIVGAEIARKHGESDEVIHAIEAHHEDVEPNGVLPILVSIADAISASRPGARRENLEHYMERMRKLEKIASSIPGVEQVFVIQAGREIRILVNPNEVPDSHLPAMAREITRTVEENTNFPGQIKVTVIREMRITDFAKSLTPDPRG